MRLQCMSCNAAALCRSWLAEAIHLYSGNWAMDHKVSARLSCTIFPVTVSLLYHHRTFAGTIGPSHHERRLLLVLPGQPPSMSSISSAFPTPKRSSSSQNKKNG